MARRRSFGGDVPEVFDEHKFRVYVRAISSELHQLDRAAPTILERIAAKDHTAVDACLAEYGGLVWRLASRYLDHAGSDVEDAVQEVFVELWLHAKRFDPGAGSEAAFVATVAHRRLIDYQRRIMSGRRVVREAQNKSVPACSRDEDGTDSTVELAIEFDRLPDAEREAIWLAIHSGMTQRQIGEATGTPLGTVKTRIRRGLARLHAALSRRQESGMTSEAEKGGAP